MDAAAVAVMGHDQSACYPKQNGVLVVNLLEINPIDSEACRLSVIYWISLATTAALVT